MHPLKKIMNTIYAARKKKYTYPPEHAGGRVMKTVDKLIGEQYCQFNCQWHAQLWN